MEKCKLKLYFITFIIATLFVSKTFESNLGNKTFVATSNWQVIEEGQSIPAGLHVRINLTTGKKEAKLMEEDSEDSKKELFQVSHEELSEQLNDNNKRKVNKQKLEKTLKKIEQHKTLGLDYSPENFEKMKERVKKSYKDYKELKKEYQDMKMNFKTDSELITSLLKEYNSTLSDTKNQKAILSILEDLNYLVHEIDNALWFINSGGLEFVLLPMIVNQTNIEYRISSLRLLGALTQNNPKAQIKVYEKNFGSYISNILIGSTNTNEISTGLYAFGSLLRRFPLAQLEILSKLGTKALIEVLSKNTNLKNKAKTLTLISDLLQDQENALNNSDIIESSYNLIEQYSEIYFDNWLKDNRFCEIVIDFIWNSKSEMLTKPDITDNIIEALFTCHKTCFPIWSSSTLIKKALNSLESDFQVSGTEYSNEVGQKITLLRDKLFPKKLFKNDEL